MTQDVNMGAWFFQKMSFSRGITGAAMIMGFTLPCSADQWVDSDLRLRFEKSAVGPTSASVEDFDFRGRIAARPVLFSDTLKFRIEPQFSSINYIIGTSSTYDYSSMTFYQLWSQVRFADSFLLKLGRQELSFGSERLLGKADWSTYGRFFDGIRMDYFFWLTSISAFYSKISQTSGEVNLSGGPNAFNVIHDFFGAYLTFRPEWADAIDVYLFNDSTGDRSTNLTSYGLRLEKREKSFFSEFEGTQQSGTYSNLGQTSESQIDLELGPVFEVSEGLEVTIEYSRASKNYNQLFPSAHEFLGAMDYFGRRNIEDLAVHARLRMPEKWRAALEWHDFSMVDNSSGAAVYDISGGHTLPGGGSQDIGQEIDLSVGKKWRLCSLDGGAALFSPGGYFSSNGSYSTQLLYAEARIDF